MYGGGWGGEKGNVYCKIKNAATFCHMGNINGEGGGGGGTNQTVYPIYCFYVDELGTLWVGADVQGLLRATINPTGFNVYPLAEEKKKTPDFFVTCIYEDDKDKVWLGTFQMGLMMLDKKTGKTSSIATGNINATSINTNIGFIKKDSNQNIWIGASDYLFTREKNSSVFKNIKIPLPANSLGGNSAALFFYSL
ncbi:MAG: two-component regulator propeller domain-containing protein [Ferruginibacter sp.]